MANARPAAPLRPGAVTSLLDAANRPAIEAVDLRDLNEFANSPRLSGENPEHTRRLAEVADPLPPIVVHRPSMRVIDGLHRMRAAQLRGDYTIKAEFFTGDDDSAFLLAVEANMAHGLPLSLCERKAAAVRLIAMFADRSDRSIAASAGISDKTVAGLRSSAEIPRSNARTGVDGRRRPVDGADRRRRAARLIARQPHTPIRDIAQEAEISLATALDVRRRVGRGEDPVPPGVTRAGSRSGSASRRRPVRRNPARDPHAVLQVLRADPALKSSQIGRDLLRWLHSHALQKTQCDELLKNAPPHCCELIADLAESYGEIWYALASRLRNPAPQALTLVSRH
jgi:ParB-like chromosome segregation protein Spo0J